MSKPLPTGRQANVKRISKKTEIFDIESLDLI
jgi:hypothetical protein